jgi:pyruvate/2-oxoacid:ferredoxin oxidoreductase beta subunit/intein/homing endonuclease
MNPKEFAQKPRKFVPGHGTCAGCGLPIAVRIVLSATDKPVVVSNATGCLEVTTTIYPYTSWAVPWIHTLFENAAANISGVETAYKVLKKKGKLDKEIKFLAFGGDGGTYDIGLQALSGALERGHKFVYVCLNNEAYMNCLTKDALIMTKSGLRKITEIKKGDILHTFDFKTKNLTFKKCIGVYDNGIKDIFEISTLHHNLKATGNHPFLIVKHNGTGKESTLQWKNAEELKKGDEVVILKSLNEGKSFAFPKIKIVSKKDYKVNVLNDIKIPEKSSPELMEYLGIYVGDGWVRGGRGDVGFSLPENKKGRERLIQLHKKIFGTIIHTNKNEVHINSVNLANFINSLGFGSGAKNKEIPGWVFTITTKEKETFVRGLLLSDGYELGESKRYVSASFKLLETLRLFLQTTGYRVGKIHKQKKVKGIVVVKRKLLKDCEYGYICFSKLDSWNVEKYTSQYKYKNLLIDSEHFSVEKVTGTEKKDREATLDLQVEGSHNFIANGYVVHNTGYQRSGATPMGANTTTAPVGKVHKGKEEFRKDLTKIIAAHNIPYVAQSSIHNYIDLYTKAKKAFETEGPAFINVLTPCIPGWKTEPSMTVEAAKLAVETKFWPIYEIENGVYTINYKPQKQVPVSEFLKLQGRFKHLFIPENKQIIDRIQERVDLEWERLLKLARENNKNNTE